MPAVVASSSFKVGTSTLAVTKPTGVATGDLLIAVNASDSGTAASNGLPTGFTKFNTATRDGGSNGLHIVIGYKIATGSEGASYSFAVGGGSDNVAAVLRITGAESTPTIVEGTSVATLVAPSVTPSGTDDLLLCFHGADPNNSTAATWTPPTGMTEVVDAQSPSWTTLEVSYLQSPSSPSGTKTAVKSGSSFPRNGACTISIKSASTGPNEGAATVSYHWALAAVGEQPGGPGQATVSYAWSTAATAEVDHSGAAAATYTWALEATTPYTHPYVAAVSSDGRYLVDQSGNGIIPQYDTVWPMIQQAGNTARNGGSATWQQDIDYWIDHKASQGFNALKCNMFGNTVNGSPNQDSRTWDSIWPFGASGDGTSLANPSTGQIEAYWERVDYLFDQAAAAGLTVFIHIFYADDVDGPGTVMSGKSTSEFQALGTFLGDRYKDRPNIVWVIGGDYFDTVRTQIQALHTTLVATGDTHLWTVQNWADDGSHEWTTSRKDDSGSTQQLGTAIAEFNALYIYDPTYLAAQAAWGETPTIPTVWYDGYYDQDSGDALTIRRFNAWALTYGAPGLQYGSEGYWSQPNGWRSEIGSPNTVVGQIIKIRQAVASYDRWTDLVPDFSSTFITAGRGSGNSFVTGGITPDGVLAIIYLPNASSAITVDTTQMAGAYTVTWVDPTNGATSSGSPGTSFSKGNNAAGSPDWLLVLEGSTTHEGAASTSYTFSLAAEAQVEHDAVATSVYVWTPVATGLLGAPVLAGSADNGASGSAYTVSVPAETVDGDLLIAVNASDWDTAALNGVPTGFTLLSTSSYDGGNNNPHLQIGYRIASSEPGSYSFPGSSDSSSCGAILRVTGADATPIIAQVAPVATLDSPTITPNDSNDLLVVFYIGDTLLSGARTWTPPAGLTEQVDRNSSDLYTGIEVSWQQSPASPSGSFTGVPQSGFTKLGSAVISIKAAVAGPPRHGQASVAYVFTTVASGQVEHDGAASTSYSWTLAGTGLQPEVPAHDGAAEVAYVWALTGTGQVDHADAATVAYTWVVEAVGAISYDAAATVAHVWALAATGLQPEVPAHEGAAEVAYSWVLATTGQVDHAGSAIITDLWVIEAISDTPHDAAAIASHTWILDATGLQPEIPDHDGAAEAVYSWALAATGQVDHQGSANLAYVWALEAVSGTPHNAAAVVAHSWTLVGTGVQPIVPDHNGQASAVYAFTAAAVGQVAHDAVATATYAWALVATGDQPIVPAHDGQASVAYLFTPAAVGRVEHDGAASVSYLFTIEAGDQVEHDGVATTAYLFVVGATAQVDHVEEASAAYVWALGANGRQPSIGDHNGAAATSYAFILSATGQVDHAGVAAVAHHWTTTAAGFQPVVPDHDGQASAAYVWELAAVGQVAHNAAAEAVYAFITEAAAPTNHDAIATTAYLFATEASGQVDHDAAAATAYVWALAANGDQPFIGDHGGAATVSYVFTVGAAARVDHAGEATTLYAWLLAATGDQPIVPAHNAAATASYAWMLEAVGQVEHDAVAGAVHVWVLAAAGQVEHDAVATASYIWTVSAVGRDGRINATLVQAWEVFGRASGDLAESWGVLVDVDVPDLFSTTWGDRERLTGEQETSWQDFARVSGSVSFTYGVGGRGVGSIAWSWAVHQRLSTSEAWEWLVKTGFRVDISLESSWDEMARLEGYLVEGWETRVFRFYTIPDGRIVDAVFIGFWRDPGGWDPRQFRWRGEVVDDELVMPTT